MSEDNTKKVSGTTAAMAGVMTVASALVGGGYQFATYEAQLRAEKQAAEAALEKAKSEKAEAIAACEKAAQDSIEEQQQRVNALMERLEAMASTKMQKIDLGQVRDEYKDVPRRWITHQAQTKGM